MYEDLEDEMMVFHDLIRNSVPIYISNAFNGIDMYICCSTTTVVYRVWDISEVAKMSHFLGGSRC